MACVRWRRESDRAAPGELARERADFRGSRANWLDVRPDSGAWFPLPSLAQCSSVSSVRLPISLLLATASVLASGAAQPSDLFFGEIPVVLTASRMAQSPLDAPVAVTVIDREMIRASGFTEIHDLLRLVPGFLVADWAEGSPTVANHGLGDAYERRIKVMIDGGTVNSPLWGNTAWQDLPVRVDDVERIEVVRGPNGAAYGVNAFQGVVNIITRSPSTQRGPSLISRVGKDGFYDHAFLLSGKAQEVVDWRMSASNRRAVNFEPYLHTDTAGRTQLNEREAITRSVFNLSATAQVATRDEISMMLGLSDGESDRGIPGSASYPLRADDERSLFLHLGWKRSFATDSELSLDYYHQDERTRAAWLDAGDLGDPAAPVRRDRDSDVSRDSVEMQYFARLSPRWRFLLGVGGEPGVGARALYVQHPQHAARDEQPAVR